MARILLTWELGAGLGHVANLRPLVTHFAGAGHEVHLALRDVCMARRVLTSKGYSLHQAPHLTSGVRSPIPLPRTHAQILHNTGFSETDDLASLVEAWRGLFRTVRPDLVIFEHSPTALLASYTIDVKRVVVGTGFCTPPDISPLPDLRPWEPGNLEVLMRDEKRVFDRACDVVSRYRAPSWDRLSQLYSGVDANLLLTLPEFDHYDRTLPRDHYFGSWPIPGGGTAEWPQGKGPRVFAYLKPFPSFGNVVSLLRDLRVRGLVYAPDVAPELRRRYGRDTIRFVEHKLALPTIAADCDLAILNANVSSATTFYLHGVPSFHIPLYLEQAIFARRFVALGGGLAADPDRPERIGSRLTTMLRSPRFADAAQKFAAVHADYDADYEIARAIGVVSQLL